MKINTKYIYSALFGAICGLFLIVLFRSLSKNLLVGKNTNSTPGGISENIDKNAFNKFHEAFVTFTNVIAIIVLFWTFIRQVIPDLMNL